MKKYKRDFKAAHCQKTWLCEKIQEMRPNDFKDILMVVPPGTLAEVYFKLKYGLKESSTGFYEDFETGEESKIGIDTSLGKKQPSYKTRYIIAFYEVTKKRGPILGLAFNRRSNMVEEFRIPKSARKGIKSSTGFLSIRYESKTHQPVGKYAKYRINTYNWNYKN
jgi:hypothetical protein